MWFGTKYGLNKYDGIDMISFKHDPENKNCFCGDFVWWLQEGRDGVLWIPTWGGGISKLDPRTGIIKSYYHDEKDPDSLGNDNVWYVYIDSRKQIWLGTEAGLNKFDPRTETFVNYQHDKNDSNSLSFNTVSAICEDSRGSLWIGTFGGGLNLF